MVSLLVFFVLYFAVHVPVYFNTLFYIIQTLKRYLDILGLVAVLGSIT